MCAKQRRRVHRAVPTINRTVLMSPLNDGMRPGLSGRAGTGPYRPLHKYLRDRFADRVVLTFGEIEDLIGCSLPEAASIDPAWWDGPAGTDTASPQAEAWTSACRTVVVNLVSRRAIFDRQSP